MLAFIEKNTDSIILNTIFLVLSGFVGYLVSSLHSAIQNKYLGDTEKKETPSSTLTDATHESKSIANHLEKVRQAKFQTNAYTRSSTPQQSNEDVHVFFIFASVIACTLYVIWRSEVLYGLTAISMLTIGLLCGAILHSYFRGVITGLKWSLYLFFTIAASLFSVILITYALAPVTAPDLPSQLETVAKTQGYDVLLKSIGLKNATWVLTHVAGVLFIFLLQVQIALSLIHYLAVTYYIASARSSNTALYFVEKTELQGRLWRNVMVIFSFSITAYIFVNGYPYVWYYRFVVPQ